MLPDFLILGLDPHDPDSAALRTVEPGAAGMFPPGAAGALVREILRGAGVAFREVSEKNVCAFYCSLGAPIPCDPKAVQLLHQARATDRRVRIIQSSPLSLDVARRLPVEMWGNEIAPRIVSPRDIPYFLPHHGGTWIEGIWALADPVPCLEDLSRLLVVEPHWVSPMSLEIRSTSPEDLSRSYRTGDLRLLYLPPIEPAARGNLGAREGARSTGSLMEVVYRLRAPGGCPWDRAHTHESLKPFLLEECHELLHAIDSGDPAALRDELGDVLLQVALHAVIAHEGDHFDLAQVADAIRDKMVLRHPHVFADGCAETPEDVEANWERIKMAGRAEGEQLLDGVPRSLPALLQAEKVQSVASRVGFDWDRVEGPLEKLREEVEEFADALETGAGAAGEMGDVLFSIVNVARFLGISPEAELLRTVEKFRARLAAVEYRATQQGRRLDDLTLEEMDSMWNDQKRGE